MPKKTFFDCKHIRYEREGYIQQIGCKKTNFLCRKASCKEMEFE